jgi:predicted short-subunit dehydrogenase-like oxidoreductase (DUF2520 family)
MAKKTVAIIGAGRVGSSVGFLLAKAGYTVTAVAARSLESAKKAAAFIGSGGPAADVAQAASSAAIVVITTPDRTIKEVCGKIAQGGGFRAGAAVVHMSGAHSLDLLDPAKAAGAHRAVIHPLQSVPGREQGVRNIPGSYFRIEADTGALDTARELVKALGGLELRMPGWTQDAYSAALYHAGAVAVSNFFVALVDYGLKFYQALGADRKEALKAVLPLIKGTLSNIESAGVPQALTGPIDRGDAKTVQGHIAAMKQRAPELLGLYRELAKQTIAAARDKGSIGDETAKELLRTLKD